MSNQLMSAELKSVLVAAANVAAVEPRPSTFLELTGRAHLEVVASNLLRFFLHPNEEHGLGHLFLDALLADLDLRGLNVTSVEGEVMTSSGKFLDLVIESDAHVIGIENKIMAGLYNPWSDYWSHLQVLAASQRTPLLLLLLIHPPDPSSLDPRIRVVTYRELMTRVRSALGEHAIDAPGQYISYAIDFIKTMENRYARSNMNPKMLELLREHPDAALGILEGVTAFNRHAADKGRQLQEAVTEALGVGLRDKVVHGHFATKLRHCQAFDVQFPSADVAVDCYLTPAGWEISVHERSEPYGGAGPMHTWLESLPIPIGPGAGGVTVENYHRIVTARFPFENPVEPVAEHVVGVLATIAKQPDTPARLT